MSYCPIFSMLISKIETFRLKQNDTPYPNYIFLYPWQINFVPSSLENIGHEKIQFPYSFSILISTETIFFCFKSHMQIPTSVTSSQVSPKSGEYMDFPDPPRKQLFGLEIFFLAAQIHLSWFLLSLAFPKIASCKTFSWAYYVEIESKLLEYSSRFVFSSKFNIGVKDWRQLFAFKLSTGQNTYFFDFEFVAGAEYVQLSLSIPFMTSIDVGAGCFFKQSSAILSKDFKLIFIQYFYPNYLIFESNPKLVFYNISSLQINMNVNNPVSPDDFIRSIQEFSFQQKYFKWQSYLKDLKTNQSQYYQASLEKFVEYYPFNHTYWAQLLDLMLKLPKGKTNTLKMYQVALAKNPRCISLWKKYLDWLKKQLIRSDPTYLRGQLQNASRIVGNHYKAGFVFEYYNQIEPSIEKRFNMLKKALVSPLQDLERMRQLLISLIECEQFMDVVVQIAQAEQIPIQHSSNPQQTKRILVEQLKQRLISLYEPTKKHIEQRQFFEKKIHVDQYIPYTDSIENWRQYIGFIKQSGNSEFLPSIYERALINQCDNQALWEQYFLLLQNEGNHQRALYLLRFHSLFFRSMSKQLTYFWLEIQERDNPVHSRQLYLQLEQSDYDLQIFYRHIQMELRSKQFNNAKAIYEAILTVFTSNLSIVTHTVLQYADFSVRYFRDIGFAKKLLQNYFKNYPFNQYLYIGLLQFYEKNVEYNKQGSKESKQIADQFIEYMLLGLKKAYEANSIKEYSRIKKVVNYHMRSYIAKIYLIKGAERKIIEQEFQLKKEQQNSSKRVHEAQNGENSIEPKSHKRIQQQINQ